MMAFDESDVHMEVWASPRDMLPDLLRKYEGRGDWYSASVVAGALVSEASTRDEFLKFGEIKEKYWDRYLREESNGGDGNGKRKDKGRTVDYGS